MCIELENRKDRDLFLKESNELKIMTRPIWTLMHKLPMYMNCQKDSQKIHNSLKIELLTFQVVLENKIIIVGYSGHSYVLIDSLIQLGKTVFGYTEKEIKKFNPYDLEYLGNEYNLDYKYLGENYSYSVAIGNNDLRTSISKFLRSKSCNLINVIHPDSSISKSVSFGSGIFIARNVSINPFTKLKMM